MVKISYSRHNTQIISCSALQSACKAEPALLVAGCTTWVFDFCSDFQASAMPLRNMVKDMKIVHAAAKNADLALPVTGAAEKIHTDTAREGYGDWDMAVPYVVLGRCERDMCGPRLGISDEQWTRY